MQERRTTVRCPSPGNAQYCAEEGGSPQDGRITDISDRGLGLLLREPQGIGEHLTVSFTLPGEDEAITTTGTVRWTQEGRVRRRWHAAGLEWFPLEETDRFRIDTFLREHAPAPLPSGARRSIPRRRSSPAIPWNVIGILSLVSASALLLITVMLQQENSQLGDMVHRRNALITRMEQDSRMVGQALGRTREELNGALGTLRALESEGGRLEGRIGMLTDELERYQSAYANLREQRGGLQSDSQAAQNDPVSEELVSSALEGAPGSLKELNVSSGL